MRTLSLFICFDLVLSLYLCINDYLSARLLANTPRYHLFIIFSKKSSSKYGIILQNLKINIESYEITLLSKISTTDPSFMFRPAFYTLRSIENEKK